MSFYTARGAHSIKTTFVGGVNPTANMKTIKDLPQWLAEVGPKDIKSISKEFRVTEASVRGTLDRILGRPMPIITRLQVPGLKQINGKPVFVYSLAEKSHAH